jgi:hypothetical protein
MGDGYCADAAIPSNEKATMEGDSLWAGEDFNFRD